MLSLNVRLRKIEGFYFPFIFNCSDAVWTFRHIKNNLLFIWSCTNKVQNRFTAWALHDMRWSCFSAAIRTQIPQFPLRFFRIYQEYWVTFNVVAFSEVPLNSIFSFDNALHEICDTNVVSSKLKVHYKIFLPTIFFCTETNLSESSSGKNPYLCTWKNYPS